MRLLNKLFFSIVAMIAMITWAGCGSGCPTNSLGSSGTSGTPSGGITTGSTKCGPPTPPPNGGGNTAAFLYYVGNDNILAASLSTTGTFGALTPFTPPTLPSNAGNDMVVVNKQFLYLPQNDSFTIQAFSINHTTGALTAVIGSPFPTSGADSITSDPAGRFLFVGNETTGTVSVFQINATTGALVAAPGSPFTAFNLDFANTLAVDGSGNFLYVSQGSPFLPVYAFFIDQTSGALTPTTGSPFGLNVAKLRTDFTGKYAVGISTNVGDNSLYVFSIDPSAGTLTPVTGSPFVTTALQLSDLKVHPSSQFVYSFGSDSNGNITAMEGFSLSPASGALTPLSGSPFTGLPLVSTCKWDQGGGESFCVNALNPTFSVFDTNVSTGGLTQTVTDFTVGDNAVPFAPTD
jgi:6-phosphogluconolactonase